MFHFVANLKPYTFHRGRGVRRFGAYLLSADFVGSHRVLARKVLRQGRHLSADNGNVDAIRGLRDRFRAQAQVLQERRVSQERRLGRYARPGDLSSALVRDFRRLAMRIREAAASIVTEDFIRDAVTRQLSMRPSYLIGMEDFTIATMTSLSIEPEYAQLPAEFYDRLNRRAVQFAVQTRDGRYGPCDAEVFAGLHAMDFDQAVAAGRIAGAAGVDGIATGLIGALTDRNAVDYRIHDTAIVELAGTVARPYVRVAEIAAGVHLGHHRAAGRRPNYHALGAGAPLLVGLLAAFSSPGTYTATDSTAPIVDGWSGATISLYVDEPAPLKLKAHKIADSWLRGGRGWDCGCSYCRNFERRHPVRLAAATRWWKAQGRPRIAKRHLGRKGPLAPLMPLLAHHPDDAIRREAGLARVGHNHNVLQRIERGQRPDVEALVGAYTRHAASPIWREAASVAAEIIGSAVATKPTERSAKSA